MKEFCYNKLCVRNKVTWVAGNAMREQKIPPLITKIPPPVENVFNEDKMVFRHKMAIAPHDYTKHPEFVPSEDNLKVITFCDDCMTAISLGRFTPHKS
jgi:hypothetical protein